MKKNKLIPIAILFLGLFFGAISSHELNASHGEPWNPPSEICYFWYPAYADCFHSRVNCLCHIVVPGSQ